MVKFSTALLKVPFAIQFLLYRDPLSQRNRANSPTHPSTKELEFDWFRSPKYPGVLKVIDSTCNQPSEKIKTSQKTVMVLSFLKAPMTK